MKIRPYQFFLIGLFSTLVILSILYWLLPSYEYYEGVWSIYKPGQSLPEDLRIKSDATNIYLLKRLGTLALIYWIQFTLIYFIAERIKRFRLKDKLVLIHFYLSMDGVGLAVFLNGFIILPQLQAHAQNIYVSGKLKLTEEQNEQLFKQGLFYDSISTPSFAIGILLLVVGFVVFINNLRKGIVNSSHNIF